MKSKISIALILTAVSLAAAAVLALSGCQSIAEAAGSEGEKIVSSEETPQVSRAENSSNPVKARTTKSESNILIAYFTWAENTKVEHPETVDVDATSSASVLLPGNTAMLAGWIQEETGGDLFSIVATEPYSSDYDECLDRAADERAEDFRPQLTATVENMNQYDIIFLGFPDWWSTCPMAVFSFLDSYDFTGKTVIPFCSHGTSGVGRSIRDLKAYLPDSEILEEIGVYRQDTENAQSAVQEWIRRLSL